MCGIFAYIGKRNRAGDIAFNGPRRLEYRGYDSWGIAVLTKNGLVIKKKKGKISEAAPVLPASNTSVAHTRWATHGKVSDKNAHPLFSSKKDFCLVHNGIVENYVDLKKNLAKTARFVTQTDTEAIVKLIEDEQKKERTLLDAIQNAFSKLHGRNTIIVLSSSGDLLAVRNGSPLVIGFNLKTKELFFSSDALSFAQLATQMHIVGNGQMVSYFQQRDTLELYDLVTKAKMPLAWEKIDFVSAEVNHQGFSHYMIKEITESPWVIRQLLRTKRPDFYQLTKQIRMAKNVYTIGAGTAGVAAAQIGFYLRKYAHRNTISLVAADADEYLSLMTNRDLIICPSQSGETADLLEFLEKAKKTGIKIASLVNMPGSTLTRISDFRFMNQAGPEIAVMSTKVFTSQIAWVYLVAKTVQKQFSQGKKNLLKTADLLEKMLQDKRWSRKIKRIADLLSLKKSIFLLGKSENLQIIKEGMIKMIEGSYIHAQAIPAGDLKHYAITLMEKNTPVVCVIPANYLQSDVLNSVNEIKARGAFVIAITPVKHEAFDEYIKLPVVEETTAILNVLPLQLLAYYLALSLGHNVDKPRNIAKSVTVK